MALHPDLAAFLELVEFGRLTGRSLPMHAMDVAQARAEFAGSSQVLDPSPPGNVTVSELQVTARDGASLDARLYRQGEAGADLRPVIFYLHGGGYVVGSLDSHDSVCRRLAALGEFAVLAADYRLAPEQQFPVALHDVLDVANWLAEQAAVLGLDNRRVVLAGDSVGASLAAVLAITAVEQPEVLAFKPLAQLLFYPVTDISCQRGSHREHAEGYLLETPTLSGSTSTMHRSRSSAGTGGCLRFCRRCVSRWRRPACSWPSMTHCMMRALPTVTGCWLAGRL